MFKRNKKSKKEKGSVKETVALAQPGKFDVVASMLSDVGCVRELNEDSGTYIQPDDPELQASKGLLILVADGMGGHSAGEVASRLAVEVITRIYYQDSGDPQSALKKAFREANREIHKTAEKDESKTGMGTTCTALVLQNGTAISAHVGDSRLYLVREGAIYLMTEDHSAVMEMVKAGLITLEQARHHPDKNVILRAMGSHPEVEVTTWQEPFPVRSGDRFLLCSDGLYDLVEDEEIKRAVESAEPRPACESLIALAKERGGHDNISVGIVSLLPVGESQTKPVPQTREVEAGI
ncbi:MAG: Stp1/IreP family PP2C-type Ser/Thr phosphatase [Acidobacteriota bacterium]